MFTTLFYFCPQYEVIFQNGVEFPQVEQARIDCNYSTYITATRIKLNMKYKKATALRALIDLAENAQTEVGHIPPGFDEPTAYIKKAARESLLLNLENEELPALLNASGKLVRTPRGVLAGETIRLDAAIITASRVAAAGAVIMVIADQDEPIATGLKGVVALKRKPVSFVVIDPAKFSTVADDTDTATSSGLPVNRAAISYDDAITKGFRVELSRLSRRGIDSEEFAEEALTAVVFGIARACDEVLLESVLASTPSAFSIASAAAQGISFSDLRGLVGTGGNGATVNQSGELKLAGIGSELTDTTSASIVGAFQHSAVAIHPEVQILVDRTSRAGDLVLQVFVDLIPLLPAPGRFWLVAA